MEEQQLKINAKAPEFSADVFHNNQVKKINLKDYKGKWVILFFYPADFTFICPTELGDVASHYGELQKLNTEVLSISTDTTFVHKAWFDHSPTIAKIAFPMVADPTAKICKAYGTYIPEEGLSLRGTFIIDPNGVLKSAVVNDLPVGRSVDETLRTLQALQTGKLTGCEWKPGEKTLN